ISISSVVTPNSAVYKLSLHDALPISAVRVVVEAILVRIFSREHRRAARPADGIRDEAAVEANAFLRKPIDVRRVDELPRKLIDKIGRAHVCTPVTVRTRMPSSA